MNEKETGKSNELNEKVLIFFNLDLKSFSNLSFASLFHFCFFLTMPVNGLPLNVFGRLLTNCCCGFCKLVLARNVVPGRGAVASRFDSKSSFSVFVCGFSNEKCINHFRLFLSLFQRKLMNKF